MAMFCGGFNWDSVDKKNDFLRKNCFEIGWELNDAEDLYSMLGSIKVGDLFCIKIAAPGKSKFRISAVGLVTSSLSKNLINSVGNTKTIGVKWLYTDEFEVVAKGKSTNVRAGTLYEEFDEGIINQVINKLFTLTK